VTRHRRYREALIELSIVANAALAAYTVEQEIGGPNPQDLRVVYGVYLLRSREVWTPGDSANRSAGLAIAPRDLASFAELGEALVRSDRIASLLTTD
jgi:carbonic anhydrase